MNAFERELMRRSPLAGAVLELCDHVLDQDLLDSIFQRHRGRCYEDVLHFDDFIALMRDALLRHDGSAHKLFLELESSDSHPIDESNFYRKLARTPVEVSRALLREGTQRLTGLMPDAGVAPTPKCLKDFALVIGDGKKIKDAAKRLAPTRGFSGKLIGAKALVAVDARSGLALAMSDSLDGMTNDVPLVPALMEQLHQIIPQPICSVWDRQFDDVRTLRRLCVRPGDAFVVRVKQKHHVIEESSKKTRDDKGRTVIDQIIMMGRGKQVMQLRRITLRRPGEEEDVIILTNLLDCGAYPAADLLELYKARWGIERVFQQVTETFALTHLIGSQPQAVLLQFSYCLLLYNVMQVIKAYVAEDGAVLASVVSMYYLFDHTRQELQAWAYHTNGSWPRASRDARQMAARLRELLHGVWDPILFTKAADKKPRGKPKEKLQLKGGHTSVLRALEGRAVVVTK
jgi:tRNA U34 5-methylaminomethyl-2-thiouridine-forming methyltransferase MnmC